MPEVKVESIEDFEAIQTAALDACRKELAESDVFLTGTEYEAMKLGINAGILCAFRKMNEGG